MAASLRRAGRRALGRFAGLHRRQRDIDELRARVASLEDEIQESRRLNRRLAELTDVVQELLVPISQRDEDKVREYLERYASSL